MADDETAACVVSALAALPDASAGLLATPCEFVIYHKDIRRK